LLCSASRVVRLICKGNGLENDGCFQLNGDNNSSSVIEFDSLPANECLMVMGSPHLSLLLETVPEADSIRLCIFRNSSCPTGENPSCFGPFRNGTLVRFGDLPFPLAPLVPGQVVRYFFAESGEEYPQLKVTQRSELDDCITSFGPISKLHWGRWCGPGHGGFQDCCQGKPCPGCNTNSHTISQECRKQCMPIDLVDDKCANHDLCTFIHTEISSSTNPNFCIGNWNTPANYCGCDCQLLRDLDHAFCPPNPGKHPDSPHCPQAKSCMSWLFSTKTNCYWVSGEYAYCNSWEDPSEHIPVSQLC